MTTAHHVLDQTAFESLAGGGGGRAAIKILRSAQLSKHLLLMSYLLARWPGGRHERDHIATVLGEASTRSPERFAEVMGEPLVGAWAAITARAVQRNRACPADFEQIGAVAMVACAAAKVNAESKVPQRERMVSLPGMGAVVVPWSGSPRLVTEAGRLFVSAGSDAVPVPGDRETEDVRWKPVRSLTCQAGQWTINLGLNDIDPYRHGHHVPPSPRLSASEVDRWRGLFAGAWQMIVEQLPERAAELAAGLRTLVPLQASARAAQSATLRHAFGVFGLTRPASAADFVVTLIHEFQHSKLSAIIDLIPLSDPRDKRRYFAPWRTDPRPLAGLLQGVYAFVGVADAWRALRAVDGLARLAEQRFAEARLQVDRGLAGVEQSGVLTEAGRVLVSRLRSTADKLLAVPVPVAVSRAAARTLEQTQQQWSRRNGSHA